MTELRGRIIFKNLKGFPVLNRNEKLRTDLFLEASKEVVSVIESFGTLFSPVVYDMNGNIEKLYKSYQLNADKYYYIENLIIETQCMENECTGNSLLWLKRALELIMTFFENILNDQTISDNLKDLLKHAYEKTLKQYHGWFIQNTFAVLYRWVPTRSQLLGTGELHNENILLMSKFLQSMQDNLKKIDALLKSLNIDNNDKI